jgi:hypothetical protein
VASLRRDRHGGHCRLRSPAVFKNRSAADQRSLATPASIVCPPTSDLAMTICVSRVDGVRHYHNPWMSRVQQTCVYDDRNLVLVTRTCSVTDGVILRFRKRCIDSVIDYGTLQYVMESDDCWLTGEISGLAGTRGTVPGFLGFFGTPLIKKKSPSVRVALVPLAVQAVIEFCTAYFERRLICVDGDFWM